MEKINSSDLQQEKLKLQVLRNSLDSEKKIVESFLEDIVCVPLVLKIQEIIQNLSYRIQELENKSSKTVQENIELRNLLSLVQKRNILKNCEYWKLLPLLYKFPSQYQIAVDSTLISDLETSRYFKDVNRFIPIHRYRQNSWSFKRFLTDCIAFARLRRLQLKYMEETGPNQSPLDKALLLEKEFAIIPDNFLLERRLMSYDYVQVYKGMDLAKNVPIIIKFLVQDSEEARSRFRSMTYQEARRRFEREAQAYEKLERHRLAKEQAANMLAEQGRKQIEDGNKKGNKEKIKAGEALLKQGEELLCDRYFVKAYCLATGELSHFHSGEDFYRESSEVVAFIVMEYVEGTDLQSLLEEYRSKKTQIPIKVFVPVMEGVLEALDYCHSEEIIHRDIRPENILITHNFKIRLTNLGRAKVEDMTQLTSQNAFVGTPGYAAPEGIVQGINTTMKDRSLDKLVTMTDHRFDIYSLGCVAYEMLTGRAPFTSNKKNLEERDEEILMKHLKESPIPPSQLRKDIPEAMSQMVMKMLAKKPDDRFGSARETLLILRAMLSFGQKAGEYTQRFLEKLSTPPPESAYPVRKSSFLIKFAAILVILLVISSPFVYIFREDLIPVMNRFRENTKQQWKEFWRQDKKERALTISLLQKIEEFYQNIVDQHQQNTIWYDKLVKDFPPEQDYTSTDEIIPLLLNRANNNLIELKKIIDLCKQTNEEDGVKALQYITQYENYSEQYSELAELVRRVHQNLKQIYQFNEKQYEERKQREVMQKKAQELRNALFAAQEQLTLIEERWNILQDRYPESKKYLDNLPEFDKNLTHHRKMVQELLENISEVQRIALGTDTEKFNQRIQSHQNFHATLGFLEDSASFLEKVLTTCKQNQIKIEQEQLLLQADKILLERQQKVENTRVQVQSLWQQTQRMLKLSDTMPTIFAAAQEESKKATSLQQQLLQYKSNNQTKEATTLAEKVLADGESTILDQLLILKQSLEDKIRIAEASEKEKQNIERQTQISTWLTQNKTQLQKLTIANTTCQEKFTLVDTQYPAYASKLAALKRNFESYKKKQETLDTFLKTIENKIASKDLSHAYQLLFNNQKENSSIDKAITDSNKVRDILHNYITEIEKIQKNKLVQQRCNSILQRLQSNISLMESQLRDVENVIDKLQKEFPQKLGYPQITSASAKQVSDARQAYQNYQNQIRLAQDAVSSQNFIKALSILTPFEGQRLEEYVKFANVLPSIQQDIIRVQSQGAIYRKNYDKLAQVSEYEKIVVQQKDELERQIPLLENKIKQLQPYSGKPGFRGPNPSVNRILQDAKSEVEELQLALNKSREYKQNEQYYQAENKLKCYDNDYLKQSKLNLVKAIIIESDNAIEHNIRVARDQNALTASINSLKEGEERARRLENLRRSPGPWYDELMNYSNQYANMEKKILSCIGDSKGSIKIYEIIHQNWGELAEYTHEMAILVDLDNIVQRSNKVSYPKQAKDYKEKIFINQYLNSNKKIIPEDVIEELQIIQSTLQEIQSEMRGLWVREETLRKLKSAQDSLDRKFDGVYENVRSVLENLANQSN